MKRIVVIPVLTIVGLSFTLGRMTGNRLNQQIKAEQEVGQAEGRWNEARLRNDAPALNELMSDDWTAKHTDGKLETKAHYIADVKSNERKYEYIHEDEISVRGYGEVAVVTGHIRSKGYPSSYRTTVPREPADVVWSARSPPWVSHTILQ